MTKYIHQNSRRRTMKKNNIIQRKDQYVLPL